MQVRNILQRTKRFARQRNLENTIRPKGELTCGINATSIFGHHNERAEKPLVQKIVERVNQVQLSSFSLRHFIKV